MITVRLVFRFWADTHECGWVPTLRPADRWTIPSAKGIASPTQTGQQVASKGMTYLPLGSILTDSQMKICGYAWASSSRNRILEIRRCSYVIPSTCLLCAVAIAGSKISCRFYLCKFIWLNYDFKLLPKEQATRTRHCSLAV